LEGKPFEELHTFVRPGELLFPVAIRINGWGHLWGNLAKGAAWSWKGWPPMLELVRTLCRFWRNTTWRNHVKRALDGRGLDLDVLKRFTANLAKWRYQTLFIVFVALDRLRQICEGEYRQEWFANAQEKETLATVWQACSNPKLWKFICCALREVYTPIEHGRRWGMVCTCPEHVAMRLAGTKHITCYYNGRRLSEAWDYVNETSTAMLTRSRTLTIADAEGDRDVHHAVRHMLEYSATTLRGRQRYLKHPPASFARTGTRQGAKDFLDDVYKYPMSQHDNVTINLMHAFGQMLRDFVDGGEDHPALAEGRRVFCLASLQEGKGEGYHRCTTLEKSVPLQPRPNA